METTSLAPETANAQNSMNMALVHLINGKTPAETIDLMKINGVNERDARPIVAKARVDVAQAKADRAKRDIKVGGLWCAGGLLVTVISYSAVSEGGGSYFICWGAVIFGGYQLMKGLVSTGAAQRELSDATEALAGLG